MSIRHHRIFNLSGKVAVVTGGGRGLGKAMAAGLAEAGAAVVVASRTQADVEASAAEIRAAGGQALAFAFDATCRAQCRHLFDAAIEGFGGLDIAVVNHGIGCACPAVEVTDEALAEMLDINLKSAFVAGQEAARRMVERGRGGAIVFTSSTGSLVAFDALATYGAAKGGVDQITRHFAQELAPHGIRVNAVAPGSVEHADRAAVHPYAQGRAPVEQTTAVRRAGTVADIAAAVLYLASDEASYVTGAVLDVNGGRVPG